MGTAKIPQNAVLCFEIELYAWGSDAEYKVSALPLVTMPLVTIPLVTIPLVTCP